jgi:hypothetical protein
MRQSTPVGVGNREIAHAPRAIGWRLGSHAVLQRQPSFFHVLLFFDFALM